MTEEIKNEISGNSENKNYSVDLYLYDISNGMAKTLSTFLLGNYIEAIYHSAIVVHGVEFFFGGGICNGIPEVRIIYKENSVWNTI
jgi:hypothetical protein